MLCLFSLGCMNKNVLITSASCDLHPCMESCETYKKKERGGEQQKFPHFSWEADAQFLTEFQEQEELLFSSIYQTVGFEQFQNIHTTLCWVRASEAGSVTQ